MLAPASVCRSQSVFTEFPSVTGLSSRASAVESDSALFGSFFVTTPMSDFSVAYTSGLWPQAFPDRSGNNLPETVAGTVADLDHQEDIAPTTSWKPFIAADSYASTSRRPTNFPAAELKKAIGQERILETGLSQEVFHGHSHVFN